MRLVGEGYVMSERGLAKRDRRGVLEARIVADMDDCGDEVWSGKADELGGWGGSMMGTDET